MRTMVILAKRTNCLALIVPTTKLLNGMWFCMLIAVYPMKKPTHNQFATASGALWFRTLFYKNWKPLLMERKNLSCFGFMNNKRDLKHFKMFQIPFTVS